MNLNPGNAEHDASFGQERIITWKISDFPSLSEAAGYFLDSPPFLMQNATWCLRVYPNVEASEAEESYVGFVVVRLKSLVPHQTVSYILMYYDYDDEGVTPREDNFDEDHKENGDMNFITRSEAMYCLDDTGALTLICKIIYRSTPVDSSFEVEQFLTTIKEIESLRQNMKNAFQCGENHDVVLNVQGKEIRAHKDILRVRSPVFEAMLRHNMIEKRSGVVDIPDCDPQAFQQFLLYLYSAEVETLDAENVLALYHIAHKYDVGHLTEKCSEFIKKRSSPRNISHVIQYALNCNDLQLLECATQYFVENINLILETVEWQLFVQHNSFQANQLLMKVIEKLNESGKK